MRRLKKFLMCFFLLFSSEQREEIRNICPNTMPCNTPGGWAEWGLRVVYCDLGGLLITLGGGTLSLGCVAFSKMLDNFRISCNCSSPSAAKGAL
eukprot:9898430-Ditylum_brightwellii.AAC.1